MESKQRYIVIKGERIPSSETTFRTFVRPVWAEHKRRERESKCRDSKGIRCSKKCEFCDQQQIGKPLSWDKLVEDGYDLADPTDITETVDDTELKEALRKAVNELMEDERRIIEIAFQGKSERKSANEVGLPRNTFIYRRDKAVGKLRKILFKNFRPN